MKLETVQTLLAQWQQQQQQQKHYHATRAASGCNPLAREENYEVHSQFHYDNIIENDGSRKQLVQVEKGDKIICVDNNNEELESIVSTEQQENNNYCPNKQPSLSQQKQYFIEPTRPATIQDDAITNNLPIDQDETIIGDNFEIFTITNKTTGKRQLKQILLPLLSLIILIIGNQNALPCYGSRDAESNDNPGLVGYNYFKRFPFLNSMRLFQTDPSELAPTQPPGGSLSSDQLTPNEGQSNSWTSMITNPFNGPQDHLDSHIRKILIPRVSGTPGNVQVRNYIVDTLKNLDYHVEVDEFNDRTPVGNVKFANIIASSNPNACRQLVIACHHDSLMMDGFLGAIDSAVPCAMMLKMADTFKNSFRSSSNSNSNDDNADLAKERDSLGLQFIFFDGEEAFEKWGPLDSLYGSRHLAAKWEKQAAPAHCGLKNELNRIEMMMVLDLIGTSDTSFINYSLRLKGQYNLLQKYEKEHMRGGGFTSSQMRRETAFRSGYIPLDFVQDDHVPFHKRGVPVLSLLAHPFPKVWHTIDDNYSAIDFPRTRRLLHVLEQFVANYTKQAD